MVTSKTTLDGHTEPLAKRAKISLSMEKGYVINVHVYPLFCVIACIGYLRKQMTTRLSWLAIL